MKKFISGMFLVLSSLAQAFEYEIPQMDIQNIATQVKHKVAREEIKVINEIFNLDSTMLSEYFYENMGEQMKCSAEISSTPSVIKCTLQSSHVAYLLLIKGIVALDNFQVVSVNITDEPGHLFISPVTK